MREALKIVATVLLVMSAIAFVLGVVQALFGPSGVGFTLIQESVISVLLSGAVWLLADIAQAANRKLE